MLINYDNIKKIYEIDEDGKIFNLETHKWLFGSLDKDGYHRYNLARDNGLPNKTYKAHRLVLITFCPIEGMEDLQVNHIDGNKLNNNVSNLEWCTCKENITHAIQNKLIYKNRKIISVEECKTICKWLEKGYSPLMIAQKLYAQDVEQFTLIIADIKRQKNWIDISKDYNIKVPYKYKNFRSNLTIFQIEEICTLIKAGYNNKEILKQMPEISVKYQDFNTFLNRIRRKEKYTNVSKYYF